MHERSSDETPSQRTIAYNVGIQLNQGIKMKILSLFFILTTLLTATAEAQSRRDNRSPSIRIEIGDDRDDREMLRRVHRLERAVRELQEKVYQLESTPAPQALVTCYGTMFIAGLVRGQGSTRAEAVMNALADCEKRAHPMHCEEKKLTCQ